MTTSADACAASVCDGNDERGSEHLDLGRGHAERVIDVCEIALARAGASWSDLTHVAVDIGPGSFTGVRAGVAAARGLALSLGVPALGVSAADAIAEHEPARPLAVGIDLRRGRVALATFGFGDAGIVSLGVDEAVRALQKAESLHLRGSCASALADGLRAVGVVAASVADAAPSAAAVARVAVERIAKGGGFIPPVPLYLRAADAVPAAPSPFATPFAQGRSP